MGQNSLLPDRKHSSCGLYDEGGGTNCKEVNGLARKILLKCHKDGVMVCLEYLCVANALSRIRKTQEWSLGDLTYCRLIKQWRNPVVEIFASKWTFKPTCKQMDIQRSILLHLGSLRQESILWRCSELGVAKGYEIYTFHCKHNTTYPVMTSKVRI